MLLRKITDKKSKNKANSRMNNRGQIIIINLLFLVITIAVMIALIPQLSSLLNQSQQSDYLNCRGYVFEGNPASPFSYNSSLRTNTLACLSIDLYLPYIILAVLIAGVSRVVLGRVQTESGI